MQNARVQRYQVRYHGNDIHEHTCLVTSYHIKQAFAMFIQNTLFPILLRAFNMFTIKLN